jgi:hypothetical protein
MVDYFKLWLIEQSNGAVARIGFTFRKLLFAAIMKQTWHVGRNAKRWEKTTWWRHMVVKDCLQSTTYFPAPDTDDYVHIITYIRIHCVYVYNNIYILYLLLLICLIDGEQQDMRLSLQHSISCCALDICQPSFALGLQISQSGHASGIGLSVYRYLFFCQFRHNSWSYGRIPPWPEISASWPIPIYRWECLKTGVPQTSHISIKVEGFGAPLFWDIPTTYDWGQKKGFWP